MMTLSRSLFALYFFIGSVTIARATMLSIEVAQSICMQQRHFFSSGGHLQGPLTAPLTPRKFANCGDCNWISWDSDCRGTPECSPFSQYAADGRSPEFSARIVGGKEAKPDSYPSFVRVLNRNCTYCGGTILSKDWVLTAGKCKTDESDPDYAVIAGCHRFVYCESSSQIVKVDKWFYPPERPSGPNGTPTKVNLALLRLKQPFEFNEKIQPVTLPTQAFDPGQGGLLTIVGGGYTDAKPCLLQAVREVEMPTISVEECRKLEKNKPPPKDWHLCLYNGDTTTASPCYLDNGGPSYLVEDDPTTKLGKKHTLVGVVDYFAQYCRYRPRITGSVSTFLFLDWIKNTMDSYAE